MLLPAKTDTILEKRFCKKYAVRFYCSGGSKIIFTVLTEAIAGHKVITLINIKKAYLKKIFISAFYNRESVFYYCSKNILQLFI